MSAGFEILVGSTLTPVTTDLRQRLNTSTPGSGSGNWRGCNTLDTPARRSALSPLLPVLLIEERDDLNAKLTEVMPPYSADLFAGVFYGGSRATVMKAFAITPTT